MSDYYDEDYSDEDAGSGKFAFAEGFYGDQIDAESEKTVLDRYKKNVQAHALEHYEIFANTFDNNNLTAPNLLYYHIYGDYRMMIDDSAGRPQARFRYVAPPENNDAVISRGWQEPYLLDHLTGERQDEINGVYDRVLPSGEIQHQFDEVPWLNQEIGREGTGTKFNLPSIGTDIVKLHSFGNATSQIQAALAEEMLELASFYDDKVERMPKSIRLDYTDGRGEPLSDEDPDEISPIIRDIINAKFTNPDSRLGPDDEINGDVSHFFLILLEQLQRNPEYLIINGTPGVPDLIGSNAVNNAIRDIYDAAEDYDNERAATKLAGALLGGGAQGFNIGETVSLTLNETDRRLGDIIDAFDASRDEVMYATFQIVGRNDDPSVGRSGYNLVFTRDESGREIQIPDRRTGNDPYWEGGIPNDDGRFTVGTDRYFFQDSDLRRVVGLEEALRGPGDVQSTGGQAKTSSGKRKKSKGKKVLAPAVVVYQRIVLDHFCTLQTLIHLSM